MKNDLILVIDMQNAYRAGEPWGCDTFERSRTRIRQVLDAAEARGAAVCLTQFIADPNGTGTWADYNAVNKAINDDAWMNELIDELKPYAAKYPVYSKSVYSSMHIPELREAAKKAERVVITGVVSECCVLSTCLSLIDMGCRVLYLKDACSGVDEAYEAAVLKILDGMSPLHVDIMRTGEYLSGSRSSPPYAPKARRQPADRNR